MAHSHKDKNRWLFMNDKITRKHCQQNGLHLFRSINFVSNKVKRAKLISKTFDKLNEL